MITPNTIYPSPRVIRGLARLQCNLETDAFDNGTKEPWHSIGNRLREVSVDKREAALRAEVEKLPGIDWVELSRELLEIDPMVEDDPEDVPADRVTSLAPPVPFPLDALPGPVREFVREAAVMLGCPPDYVAVPLLASVSAAIGTTVRLEIKRGWCVWPALYTAVVAPSGAKKSPAMQCALQFVNARSLEFDQYHDQALQNYERQLAEYKSATERRRHTKDKSNLPEVPDKPKRPVHKRATIGDATVEAIGKRLSENPRGLLLARDEIAGLLLGMNQYRGGRGNDEQFFLTLWDSTRTTIDRKLEDDPVVLHQPFLSITGGIQPGVLPKILGRDRLEDGFTARMLFAYPEPLPSQSSDATMRDETIDRTSEMFERLFNIQYEQPYSLPPQPHLVRLTAGARDHFKVWENAACSRIDTLSDDDPFRAPLSKMSGYVGRLALILHVAKWTERQTDTIDAIEVETVAEAIQLADYFIAHAERVWQRLVESREDRQFRSLIQWMRKRRRPVSVRDIQSAGVGGLRRSIEVQGVVSKMKEDGLVEQIKVGKSVRYSLRCPEGRTECQREKEVSGSVG